MQGAIGVESPVDDPFAWIDGDDGRAERAIDRAIEVHGEHWALE